MHPDPGGHLIAVLVHRLRNTEFSRSILRYHFPAPETIGILSKGIRHPTSFVDTSYRIKAENAKLLNQWYGTFILEIYKS
jgi:hypothetical protein